MTKRLAVQVLRHAGHTQSDEAAQLGVSEQAVRRRTFGAEYVAHQLGELDRLARLVFVGEVRQ